MNLRINQIGFVENYLKNVLDERASTPSQSGLWPTPQSES